MTAYPRWRKPVRHSCSFILPHQILNVLCQIPPLHLSFPRAQQTSKHRCLGLLTERLHFCTKACIDSASWWQVAAEGSVLPDMCTSPSKRTLKGVAGNQEKNCKNDKSIIVMDSVELWLLALGLHQISLINYSSWMRDGACDPASYWRTGGCWSILR